MAGLDAARAKKNFSTSKSALMAAAKKTKDGKPKWVGFAFAPGKDKNDHIVMFDARKKGTALMADIKKAAKDRKELCCGVATVTPGGTPVIWVKFIKKLPGADRKMKEAVIAMKLRYLVKVRKPKDEPPEAAAAQDADEDATDHEPPDDDTPPEELENAISASGDDDDEEAEGGEDEGEEGDEEPVLNMTRPDAADDEEADEGEDEDDNDAGDDSHPPGSAKHKALGAAPAVWHKTRDVMSGSLGKLKAAIKKEYSSEAPELIAEIEKSMSKIDAVIQKLDHRLAESLDKAHKAPDGATRKAELARAKNLLKEHITYIKSEPLIAHIDNNPFGVDVNLQKILTASLSHVAKVVS